MFIILAFVYIIIAIFSGRFLIFPTLDLVRRISFTDSFYEDCPFSENVLLLAAIIISIVIAIIIFVLVKEYINEYIKNNSISICLMLIGGMLIPLIIFIVMALLLILIAAAYWIFIIICVLLILIFILVLDTFEDII